MAGVIGGVLLLAFAFILGISLDKWEEKREELRKQDDV